MWAYDFDANHRLTSYKDPALKTTLDRYDSNGRIDQITDPRSNVTAIGYDTSGRVTSVKRVVDGTTANDVTTTYAYSAASAPCAAGDAGKTVVTDPRGHATTYCVDAKDQVVKVRNAKNHDTARTYTPNGDTDLYTGLAGTATSEPVDLTFATSGTDPSNNLLSGQAGSQEPFSLGYCSDSGLPTCSGTDPLDRYRPRRFTDEQGTGRLYGYNTAGDLTSVSDSASPARNQATLTYNGDGTIATATDGEGHQTTFEYFTTGTNAGNLKKITPPLPLGATQYTYDSLGRVDVITDPRGSQFDFDYDKLDRVTAITLGTGYEGGWTFSYDGNGNVVERFTWPQGSTFYVHDKLNRRTKETFPGPRVNDYTWDKSSNLKTLADPGGTVTYGYDEIDRVASIAAPNAAGTGTETVGYTYDDTPSNGPRAVVETFPGGATQRTELNTAGKPTKIKASTSSGTALSTLTYDYGELVSGATKQRSLIQSVTDQAGNKTAYTYKDTVEDVGRLLKARTTTSGGALVEEWRYSYDKAGNRLRRVRETPTATTTTSYAYNDANQLCWSFTGVSSNACGAPPAGAYGYTFDSAGNQTNGSYTFAYDYAGRTAAINGYSEGYLTLDEEELVEDGPIALQNNLLGLGRQTRYSSYVNYHRNPDTGALVSLVSDGTKRYVLRDQLGSTTGLLNSAGGGSIARSYRYDPDGNETTTGSGPDTTILFAGGLRAFAGLYHFGARHYDTTTARWTQPDPINQYADLRQANLYVYVGGDPINLTDPTGFAFWDDVGDTFSKIGKRAPVACYAYNAVTDEENDLADEVHDLNECFNPVAWVD